MGKKCYYLRGILLGVRTPKPLCHMLRMSWTFNFIPYSTYSDCYRSLFHYSLLRFSILFANKKLSKLSSFVQALPVIH